MKTLFLAAILLTAVGAGAARADSWIEHRDPLGFTIRHPQGWTVSSGDDDTIVVRDRANAFVLIHPFYLPQLTDSETWLRGAPRRFSSVFPGAQTSKLEQTGRTPDQSMATLSYRSGGKQGRANLLCSIYGRSGMFYAIAGPPDTFDSMKGKLVQVLASLKFTQPTIAHNASGGAKASAVKLDYTRWQDGREGAFSVEVPRAWRVEGGLVRRNALDPRQAIDMTSPDGTILVRAGDGSVPAYILPSASLAVTGFVEGTTYTIGAGLNYIVARFEPGVAFAKAYLTRRVTAPYSDIQIKSETDRPDLARQLHAIAAQYGEALVQYTFSVGEVAFTCRRDGHTLHGLCYGTTILSSSGGFNIWSGVPAGYVVPEGKEAVAETALRHALATWQIDATWAARQSATAVQVSKIAARSNAEISKTINDTYWHRAGVMTEISRRRSNATLGLTDTRDPDTGETWKVAAGHNYYWRKGDKIVGTETYTRPDIDFTPLKQW